MQVDLSLPHHVKCNGRDSQAHGKARNNDTYAPGQEIEGALLRCAPFYAKNLTYGLGQERAGDLIIQVQQWT